MAFLRCMRQGIIDFLGGMYVQVPGARIVLCCVYLQIINFSVLYGSTSLCCIDLQAIDLAVLRLHVCR